MSTQKKSSVSEALKIMKKQIKSEKEDEPPKEFDIKKAAELMSKSSENNK